MRSGCGRGVIQVVAGGAGRAEVGTGGKRPHCQGADHKDADHSGRVQLAAAGVLFQILLPFLYTPRPGGNGNRDRTVNLLFNKNRHKRVPCCGISRWTRQDKGGSLYHRTHPESTKSFVANPRGFGYHKSGILLRLRPRRRAGFPHSGRITQSR